MTFSPLPLFDFLVRSGKGQISHLPECYYPQVDNKVVLCFALLCSALLCSALLSSPPLLYSFFFYFIFLSSTLSLLKNFCPCLKYSKPQMIARISQVCFKTMRHYQ